MTTFLGLLSSQKRRTLELENTAKSNVFAISERLLLVLPDLARPLLMQPTPLRLAQALRTTFQASKPPSRQLRPLISTPKSIPLLRPCLQGRVQVGVPLGIRFYADHKTDIDSKIEDTKSKIEDALEARADHVYKNEPKPPQDHGSNTIVHALSESSSIDHTKSSSETLKAASSSPEEPRSPRDPTKLNPTPSLSTRLSILMDNLQSNLFVASRRLNDLTGYSDIQRLKDDILQQEEAVSNARSLVKRARAAYAAAITTRSTTQREVNDLLHRKHTWSPGDLERFTNLYRSDHANERAEEQAQQELSHAETGYEEASTRLARSILARYHEEQIWSDKIRQMSTWGTWGLMGLNILLFVVFQIAIEPWRRRRLVRGFEEKVQEALNEVGVKSAIEAQGSGAAIIVIAETEGQGTADSLVQAAVDGVSGVDQTPAPQMESQAEVEAVKQVVDAQEGEEDISFPEPVINKGFSFATTAASAASGYAYYREAFAELFSERKVVMTQRDLTAVALEGAAGGAALIGLLVVLLRPR
jgi:sensitive to high expression protein 9, mitochondrial